MQGAFRDRGQGIRGRPPSAHFWLHLASMLYWLGLFLYLTLFHLAILAILGVTWPARAWLARSCPECHPHVPS